MAVILMLLLMTRTAVAERCGVDTSVDITEGQRFENDTIAYNGTRYTPGLYYEAADNKTRGCICKIVNCYRKCCGRTEIYHEDSFSCLDRSAVNLTSVQNETMNKYFEEFEKLEEEHGVRQVNGFNELNGCDNQSCLFRTDYYKSHELTEEGVLVVVNVDAPDEKLDVDRYCIDIMLYVNEKTGEMTLGREAYFRGKVYEKVEEYTQNYIAMVISAVFILLTIAVHLILPDMKKSLHGRNLLCHLCSMLVSFVFIAAMQMSITFNNPTKGACLMFSFVIYFSFLAAFFWLNVMCFDMWRKFRFTRAVVSGDVQKRFRRYCMYAFGLPLLLTVLLAVLEFSPIEDHTLLPRMRKRECFLSGNGKLIYLYIPILLVCLSNIVLFILTTVYIVKTENKTKRHLKSENSKNSKAKDKQRLLTYVKLFIVMGITWILEVVSYIFPEANVIWKITDVFNALSGLFIFIIVVCNKEKLLSIQKRFEDIFNIQKDTSSVTMNMDLSQSVLRNIQNLEERRKTEKKTNQGAKTSETNQNSNINQISGNGNPFSQINGTNESFNEENSDFAKGQGIKEDAMPKEEIDCETLNESESAIKSHKKDDSENERKDNEHESSNKGQGTTFTEQSGNSEKKCNDDKENGCHNSEENSGMNHSCKNEKHSETEESLNTIETHKINEENILQENESSSALDGDNKDENELQTNDNE